MPAYKHRMTKLFLRATLFASTIALIQAQTDSRTAEIEAARDRKESQLSPDTPNTWEQRLIYVKDAKVLERLSAGIAGVRLKIGGMPTGSGFAIGPDWFREDWGRGEMVLNAGAQGSTRMWHKEYASVKATGFAKNKLWWEAEALHHDYNSLTYYGPGPDSEKSNRTNYRLEQTTVDTMLGGRPVPMVRLGGSAGYLRVNVGAGQDERYASSEKSFPAVPGFLRQTDFFRTGLFAQLDYRDNPIGTRAGGNYTLRYDYFHDQDLNLHDFRRLDLELQQYIPLYNKRRVIVVRTRAIQSFTRPGQVVPFYQQASLGGGNDLRGFRPYRFHDDNMLAMNAEYRWEVFSGLDMALFFDAGRVSPRRWQFQFSQLETAAGFGLRFNVRNATFMRIDAGFSHEGFQVFVKFNGIFGDRSLHSSLAPHLF